MRYHLREKQNGERENNRHDARLIDAKRKVRGNASHHFHAAHAPRVRNGYRPLRLRDKDNARNDDEGDCGKSQICRQLRNVKAENELRYGAGNA